MLVTAVQGLIEYRPAVALSIAPIDTVVLVVVVFHVNFCSSFPDSRCPAKRELLQAGVGRSTEQVTLKHGRF